MRMRKARDLAEKTLSKLQATTKQTRRHESTQNNQEDFVLRPRKNYPTKEMWILADQQRILDLSQDRCTSQVR
jgi:hypothetical protein